MPGRDAPFEIPLPPLQAVTSITTYARTTTPPSSIAALYRVDAASAPARIAWKETTVAPTDLRNFNALAIAFTAGYGDAASDVPEPIRRAILMIVADLYVHRGDACADARRQRWRCWRPIACCSAETRM